MKYIEYISTSKYGRLWIAHSVVTDWKHVLSYEMKNPLWNGKFFVYNYKDWKDKEKYITFSKKIKYFKIKHYEWVAGKWITCFEALNNIQPMPNVKDKIKRISLLTLIISISSILLIVFWFLFWYYWFTMSEEEFLEYKHEICL